MILFKAHPEAVATLDWRCRSGRKALIRNPKLNQEEIMLKKILLAVLFITVSLSAHAVPLNTQLLTSGDFSQRWPCRLTSNCYYPVYWQLANKNSSGAFTLENALGGLLFYVSSIKPGGESVVYQWQATKVDPYGTYRLSVDSRCNVPLEIKVKYTNSHNKFLTNLLLAKTPYSYPIKPTYSRTVINFELPAGVNTIWPLLRLNKVGGCYIDNVVLKRIK